MIKKLTVAEYFEQLINISGKSQKDIAEEMGYDKPNIITMIKQGKTRLPINRVAAAAQALDADPVHLLRITMQEYMPDTWDVIETLIGEKLVSAEEASILEIVRGVSGGQAVRPETQEEIDSLKELVKTWKKKRDSNAAAAARRIAAAPKNKRT